MDLAELNRRLADLIRFGTILAVDLPRVRCKVKSGRLETGWLRWATARAGTTRTWDPPTVGEQCLVLSPSGNTENGVVIYGLNSDLIPPPSQSADTHVTDWPDGARYEYDHATHTWHLALPEDGRIVITVGRTTLELTDAGTTLTTPEFEGNQS